MPLNRRQLMTGALATVAATTSAGRWATTATAAEGLMAAARVATTPPTQRRCTPRPS